VITLESLWEHRLERGFFARDAVVVARALVGTYLVHGDRVVRIVETEAYRGPKDLACHARAGLTKRTRTLLGHEGHAYVFFIYGVYDCFNVVCGAHGKGHAVLVRGGDPVLAIPHGARTDGPGRLTRALGITRAHDGHDLTKAPLFLSARTRRPKIAVSARVGVAYAGAWAEKPWRFFDAESRHVSKPSARLIGLGASSTASPKRSNARARSPSRRS
jgi:DNA-3-methyladenine glycosylase